MSVETITALSPHAHPLLPADGVAESSVGLLCAERTRLANRGELRGEGVNSIPFGAMRFAHCALHRATGR